MARDKKCRDWTVPCTGSFIVYVARILGGDACIAPLTKATRLENRPILRAAGSEFYLQHLNRPEIRGQQKGSGEGQCKAMFRISRGDIREFC